MRTSLVLVHECAGVKAQNSKDGQEEEKEEEEEKKQCQVSHSASCTMCSRHTILSLPFP
jgi:hypothetical protein